MIAARDLGTPANNAPYEPIKWPDQRKRAHSCTKLHVNIRTRII
jgi:hypothetical protein